MMRWLRSTDRLFSRRGASRRPAPPAASAASADRDARIDERYLLETFLANTPDHVYFKDADSRFTQISRSLARWMGVETESDCLGLTDFDFFAEAHAAAARRDELHVMRTGEPIVDLEEQEVWPDGRTTWVSTTKVPLYSRDGRVIGIFGLSRDITARKLAEERARHQAKQLEELTRELEELAIHDPLTGLYNRRGVDLMGGRAMSRALMDGTDVCVLFIDVDGLKVVNDTLGHAAGDRVLAGVSAALRSTVRSSDIVGRIGGDEFAIVVPGQSSPEAEELRVRVEHAIEAVPHAGESVAVSIGIATVREDLVQSLDGLIDVADRAMYEVKRRHAQRRDRAA